MGPPSRALSAGIAAVAIIPAHVVWRIVPGYQLLEPEQAAAVTSLFCASFMWVSLTTVAMVETTLRWSEKRLDSDSNTTAKELCRDWIRVILGRM